MKRSQRRPWRPWRAWRKKTGKGFGDAKNPLLVSVRSGAAVSMPGMMDTVLNLGLTDETARGMAEATQNPRFAYDSYRRFIQMFANVVMELDMTPFEAALEAAKQAQGVKLDRDLSAESLMELVKTYQGLYEKATGKPFPQDPKEQLVRAIEAVFRSWNTPRANYYRQLNDIPSTLGTAVNVQSMVFGNMGDDCGTGVAFTRSPSTGENKFYGEYLMNAQGEDVVAGIRTPQHIDQLKTICRKRTKRSSASRKSWNRISMICRISNLPSSAASCICCKPETASAPCRRRCKSRWIWWRKARSAATMRS